MKGRQKTPYRASLFYSNPGFESKGPCQGPIFDHCGRKYDKSSPYLPWKPLLPPQKKNFLNILKNLLHRGSFVCYNILNNFKGEIKNSKTGEGFFIPLLRLSPPIATKKCNSLAVSHVYINEKRDKPMKTARNEAEIKNGKHLLFSPPLLREFQINPIYHPIHSL